MVYSRGAVCGPLTYSTDAGRILSDPESWDRLYAAVVKMRTEETALALRSLPTQMAQRCASCSQSVYIDAHLDSSHTDSLCTSLTTPHQPLYLLLFFQSWRVFLAGNSEGAVAVSQTPDASHGVRLRGRIVMAWSMERNYYDSAHHNGGLVEPHELP